MIVKANLLQFFPVQEVSAVKDMCRLFHRLVKLLVVVSLEHVPLCQHQNRTGSSHCLCCVFELVDPISELFFPQFVRFYLLNELNLKKSVRAQGWSWDREYAISPLTVGGNCKFIPPATLLGHWCPS